MNAPKFEIFRTTVNGKPAVEMVVRNSMADPYLHTLVTILGYEASADIANRRAIVCTTTAEVDAARDPISGFFNTDGTYKN